MNTILITDCDMGPADLERAVLEPAGFRVVRETCRTEDEVIAKVRETGAVGLLVQYAPMSRRVLAACGGVRALTRYGVGMDNVDTAAAEELGIVARNVTDYGSAEVADQAMTLLLALLRGLPAWTAATRRGEWPVRGELPDPRELRSCTLGLLGFGAIAREVCVRAQSFGMRVVAHDPYLDDTRIAAHGAEPVPFDALWQTSDAVSVHMPLTEGTHGIVGSSALNSMSRGSYLINTARAGLVDREALSAALESGRLAGVGLDVWWEEPAQASDALARHPQVVLTPHIAWLSTGSVGRLRTAAAERLLDTLKTTATTATTETKDNP